MGNGRLGLRIDLILILCYFFIYFLELIKLIFIFKQFFKYLIFENLMFNLKVIYLNNYLNIWKCLMKKIYKKKIKRIMNNNQIGIKEEKKVKKE